GLAGIRQADEAHVGDDLQLQDDPALLAGVSLLDLSRGPVRRRLEGGVAATAATPARHDHPIAGRLEVAEHVATVPIPHQGPRRDLDHPVLAAAPESVGPLPMIAPGRPPVALVREMGEVGVALRGAEDNAPARTAVTSVGPAARRVLLPPKAQAA